MVGENSSIHGVRQLSLTYHHSKLVLVGWIVTICAAFITICYQTTTLTSLILTYPSTIDVSISLERSIFPTVTACNMGVYKKSVVENIDTFVQMIQTQHTEGNSRPKRQTPSCSACTVVGDSCYIHFDSYTYMDNAGAQSSCASAGGKLPFFSTMAQYNSFYAYQISTLTGNFVWLGFWNYSPHNPTTPGIWRDSNGTGSVLSFSFWRPTYDPSGSSGCALNLNNNNGWVEPSYCSYTYNVICMCQSPTTTTSTTTTTTTTPTTTTSTTTTTTTTSTTTATTTTTPTTTTTIPTTTTSTTPTTTTSTTALTTTTVTIAAAAQIPAISAAAFISILATTDTNGTTDTIAAASQLNSAMEIVTSSLTGAALQELGFKQSDFITACLFSGIPCNNEEKLTLVQIPEFLNCYAFNHRNQHSLLTSDRSGERFGLSMTFNIHSEEYLNTMSVAGVQLFVQEQTDPILPGSMGRVYSPGLLYSISISKRIENLLSVPGRSCLTSAREIPFNLFKNDTYYTESCLRSYLQLKLIKNCGCGSTKYPLPNDNTKFCDLTTAKCASNYLTSNGAKLIEEAQKACPPACRSVTFDVTTTFAKLSPQRSLLENLNMTRSTYMNHIVMVKLFFAKDTVMVYTEELNFGVVSIFANFGGSLGCIAGLSVISIAEMIYMIAKGVATMKKKCH